MANIERAASLFLVKNTYSLVLAIIAAATLAAYPFAPIQLTLISTVTIGVPGFVLALGPNRRRYFPGFLRRVLRLAVPAGLAAGAAAYAGYRATRVLDPAAGLRQVLRALLDRRPRYGDIPPKGLSVPTRFRLCRSAVRRGRDIAPAAQRPARTRPGRRAVWRSGRRAGLLPLLLVGAT